MFNWLKSKFKPILNEPKTLGQRGEEFAQGLYVQQGYKIIGTNIYNKKGLRKGEIDFIAQSNDKIIFVEVKTRTSKISKFGSAEESVDIYKQRKLLKAVKLYLAQNTKYQNLQPQIDVCIVDYNQLDNTFKNARILMNAVEDIY